MQSIAAVVSAAISGFLNPRGPNSSVEVLQRKLAQDEAQRSADMARKERLLDKKGEVVEAGIQSAVEDIEDRARRRMATFEAARQLALAESGQYTSMAIRARGEQTAAAMEDQIVKEADALAAAVEQRDYARTIDKEKLRIDRAQIGLGVARLKEDARQFDLTLDRQREAMIAQGQAAQAEVFEKQRPTFINDPENPGVPLSNHDGTIVRAFDEQTARDLRKSLGFAGTTIKAIDDISNLYRKSGGEFETLNSEEAQRLNAIHADLMLAFKERANLGAAFTETEMKIIQGVVGKSPTSFFSNISRWSEARGRVIEQANRGLHEKSNFQGEWYPTGAIPGTSAAARQAADLAERRHEVQKDIPDTNRYLGALGGIDMAPALERMREIIHSTDPRLDPARARTLRGQAPLAPPAPPALPEPFPSALSPDMVAAYNAIIARTRGQ